MICVNAVCVIWNVLLLFLDDLQSFLSSTACLLAVINDIF